ncbi:hypothetical protein QP735_04200 [Curtobacterium citreum]|uniref:hypothetical protein n=1 Tax=Curtobacterium citreum TaxID=2036 RepID=UPI002550BF7E|nr:hypothetical protein [Curtobacterium citreum]MDK8171725.1 hypothetical protein [Curtobacterium citreum]
MTDPTPEQMRVLAEDLSYVTFSSDYDAVSRAVTALRAAADQLEAVQKLLQECSDWEPGRRPLEWSITDHYFVDTEFWSRLTAIIDPETSQEDDDD